MIGCIILGILFIIFGIFIVLKPEFVWQLTESWKSYRAVGASDLYIKTQKIGGIAFIIFGLFLIVFPITVTFMDSSNSSSSDMKWDCSVTCAEESTDDSYIITYSDVEIVPSSSVLTFQNQNDFDIKVYINGNISGEEPGDSFEISAGGVFVAYQLKENTIYTLGCHADVEEGTLIKLMVYDGERAEVY